MPACAVCVAGMDPDGIKVRAASGYHAADYIMGGYSLWGPLIENLAQLGYDHNSMYAGCLACGCGCGCRHQGPMPSRMCGLTSRVGAWVTRRMAPYDWRLGFPYLEQRDQCVRPFPALNRW